MSVRQQQNVAYGLSEALINVPLLPIVSNRVPTTNDKAAIGTLWIDKLQNQAYVLTSIVNNLATWEIINQGAADFVNFSVQTVNANPTPLIIFSPAPSSGFSFMLNFVVMQSDFSTGGGGIYQGTVRRAAAGAPVIPGQLELVFNDDTGGALLDMLLVIVGNDIELQVTGIAATVFNWKSSLVVDQLP